MERKHLVRPGQRLLPQNHKNVATKSMIKKFGIGVLFLRSYQIIMDPVKSYFDLMK